MKYRHRGLAGVVQGRVVVAQAGDAPGRKALGERGEIGFRSLGIARPGEEPGAAVKGDVDQGWRRGGKHILEALEHRRHLLALVEGRSVALEEYARQMIHAEELHLADVDKMLRKPGELRAFSPHAI